TLCAPVDISLGTVTATRLFSPTVCVPKSNFSENIHTETFLPAHLSSNLTAKSWPGCNVVDGNTEMSPCLSFAPLSGSDGPSPLPPASTTVTALDADETGSSPSRVAVDLKVIFLPSICLVNVSFIPFAPSIGSPSASHWFSTSTSGSLNSAGVPVRVSPTSGVPEIEAAVSTFNGAFATSSVGADSAETSSSPRVATDLYVI